MSLPSVHTELPVLQETEFAYYKDGYRYQLVRPFCAKTKIRPARVILTEWIILTPDGWLYIRPGYAWDGASGPAVNTRSWVVPSLIHDALCQLMALKLLPVALANDVHDEMHRFCLKKGMLKPRAWYSREAVKLAWTPKMSKKEELSA